MKVDLFVLLTAETDESLRALGRAIRLRSKRRPDYVLVRRGYVRASDLLRGRVTTKRMRMRPRESVQTAY